jgi:NAD(P)-dependent dehydrogenase (short-subunit alcohol dehydrogenase family)
VKRALITGAGNGIGAGTAKLPADRGWSPAAEGRDDAAPRERS